MREASQPTQLQRINVRTPWLLDWTPTCSVVVALATGGWADHAQPCPSMPELTNNLALEGPEHNNCNNPHMFVQVLRT